MKKSFEVKLNSKTMSYMAMFTALHIILQVMFNVIPGQPQGGNISLDLLPILLVSYIMGAGYGLLVGVMATCLQFALGIAHFYGPWSVVLDYLVPVAIVGGASLFKNIHIKSFTIYTGILVTMILKFVSHFISGVWLFAEYVPEGMNGFVYSFGYNIVYCLPTLILCYIAFVIIYPRIQRAIHL